MPQIACPGEHELRRFMRGEAPDMLAAQLGEHLESCPSCLRMVQSLELEDPLVHALRSAGEALPPSDDAIARQIVKCMTRESADTDSEAGTVKTVPPTPPPAPPAAGQVLVDPKTITQSEGGGGPGGTLTRDGSSPCDFDLAEMFAPPQAADELGRLGSYRVLGVLGRGGMGVVLLAEDLKLGRRVALKVMLPRLIARDSGKQRFLREARAAARLRHDNMVVIHHVDEDRGIPFLAMEYLEGETLDSRLKRVGRLPLEEMLRIGTQLAHGLAAAHQCGLIHRDVKPGNIWLEAGSGRVKLLDFGLVRAREEDGRLTGDGGWLGTPAYMAPEQVLDPSNVEPAADLFSLGCVLYEMSTGAAPFAAGDAISVKINGQRRPPTPPDMHNVALPAAFTNLVLRLLSPEPDRRGAGAAAVAAELERIVRPAAAPRRLRPRWLWAAGLLLPLVLGLAGVILVLRTPAGEVTVETDDPNIELTARGPDLVRIRDLKNGTVLTLDAGKYTLAMADDPDGLTVDLPDGPVVLRRAGAKVVTITRRRPVPVAVPGAPAPGEPVPADGLDRAAIPRAALAWLGRGDPDQAPPELVAVLGDGRLRVMPRASVPVLGPDGRWLAVPSRSDVVLFDAHTGQYVRSLRGHSDLVYTARFSPDGRMLASAGIDRIVRLWEVPSGRLLRTIEAHTAAIPRVAFNHDGTRLATASDDRTAGIWDVRTGARLQRLTGHTSIVSSVAFHPDGQRVATGSWNWEVRVWDVASGGQTQRFRVAGAREGQGGYPDLVTVAFSPDGTRLAAGNDHGAQVWDTTTWKHLWQQRTAAGFIDFTPDNRYLLTSGGAASGAQSLVLRRWEAASGAPVTTVALPSVGFLGMNSLSKDGKTLAACGEWNGAVQIYDAQTGKPRFPVVGHPEQLEGVAFSPDGKWLASAGREARIGIWNLATGKQERVLTGHTAAVRRVVFLPDAQTLASCGEDRTVRLWEICTGKLLWTFADHKDVVYWVAASPDGRTLASCGADQTVRLFDWRNHTLDRTIDGLAGVAAALSFSRDGKRLAVAVSTGKAHVWDTATGRLLRTFTARLPARLIAFLPDGDRLLVGCEPSLLQEFSLSGDASTQQLMVAPVLPTSLAVRPDGRLSATSGAGGVLQLIDWDARPRAAQTYRLFPYDGWVPEVAVSAEGRYLATANPDGTVYLFRLAGPGTKTLPGLSRPDVVLQPTRQCNGHQGPLFWVAFSRDGKTACSASMDKTVRVWNVDDATQRHSLPHPAPTCHVAVSRDDREILTTCDDGIVRIWSCADGKLVRQLDGTHSKWVLALAPDGQRVVTHDADPNGKTILSDFGTGKRLARLAVDGIIDGAIWSPDGKRLLSTMVSRLGIADASNGSVQLRLLGHQTWIRDLAVSPDGRLALSCAGSPAPLDLGPAVNIWDDCTVRLWDLTNGQELQRWRENHYARYGVRFTPGGRRAVAGSKDGTIRVYDIASGNELARLESPAPVHGIDVAPDGHSVIGGCGDGVLRLWQLPDGIADPPR
jgi:WD40 repeat protein/serine/threonine protein kinase